MRRHLSTSRLTILVCVLLPAAALLAQDGPPPRAKVTPILEQDSAAPGSTVRTAVRVVAARRPPRQRAQAARPQPDSRRPDRDAPSGVTVEEIVYPEPTDLRQENAPSRSASTSASFWSAPCCTWLRMQLPGLSRSRRGSATRRATRRCATRRLPRVEWAPAVVRGRRGARQPRRSFPASASAPVRRPALRPPAAAPGTAAAAATRPRASIGFTILGTAAGYLSRRLPDVHQQRRSRRGREGLFEGRGPLAILCSCFVGGLALNLTPCVLPMIPINLAIIGAGAQAGSRAAAGSCSARPTAARWRSSTACSA